MADHTHDILADVVSRVQCKPGWSFRLQDEDGALPGEDPYTVHEYRPEVDALTTQDGSIRTPYTE